MSSAAFFQHTLDNGLRIVVEEMPHSQSVAAGFLVRTGARDEVEDLAGVSHFVEHMCFKGTPKRDWQAITREFDEMGSTYNAYTSKERTVYFGWVRHEDLERQVDLIADMMRSAMPTEEFDMEKNVILEEIAMSDDSLEREVFDQLHQQLFAGHPLAWPILGTTDSIKRLTRDQLHGYFQERYHPANMVLVVAGGVKGSEVVRVAEKLCGGWPTFAPRPERQKPKIDFNGTHTKKLERFSRQALGLIFDAPGAAHDQRETADVMATLLGGPNSLFYWNIIQAGVAPYVAAGRLDYCDIGMMLAFGFCEPDNAQKMHDAMRAEIDNLYRDGIKDDDVRSVCNKARTSLAGEAESPYHRLMQMFGDIDVLGQPRTVEQRLSALEAVTPNTVREYLDQWPLNKNMAVISVGPREFAPAQ